MGLLRLRYDPASLSERVENKHDGRSRNRVGMVGLVAIDEALAPQLGCRLGVNLDPAVLTAGEPSPPIVHPSNRRHPILRLAELGVQQLVRGRHLRSNLAIDRAFTVTLAAYAVIGERFIR